MAAIASYVLGDGVGYIYWADPNGNQLGQGYVNTEATVLGFRKAGLVNAPFSGEKRAIAILEITAVAGATNLASLTINGVNQVTGSIVMTVGNPVASAAAIASAINSNVPAGPNYSAMSYDAGGGVARVKILAPSGTFDTVNGHAVSPTFSVPGNITYTCDAAMRDGSNPLSDYDTRSKQQIGTRAFIDVNPSATISAWTSSRREITHLFNIKGLGSPRDTQTVSINGNAITFTRKERFTDIIVQGGGADFDIIDAIDAQAGDEITICGYSAGNGAILKDVTAGLSPNPNVYLTNGLLFPTDDATQTIVLQYKNDNTYGYGWFEISPRHTVTTATVRGGGLATPIRTGVHTITVPAPGGTFNLTPGNAGVSPNGIHNLSLTGTVALLANYTVAVDTTDAKNGDSGFIEGKGSAVTVSPGARLIIGGYDIADAVALVGAWRVEWSYNGTTLRYNLLVNPFIANWVADSMIPSNVISGSKITTGTITTAKLDPANIDLSVAGLPGSVTEPLMDAALLARFGVVRTAVVHINNATALTMHAAPVVAVPAPGAGYFLIPTSGCSIRHNFDTAAFAAGPDIQVIVDTAAQECYKSAIIHTTGSTRFQKFLEAAAPGGGDDQIVENKAIVITATAALTLGGGSFDVVIEYLLVQV